MKLYRIFFLFLFIGVSLSVRAEVERFFFTDLDVKDGLSQQTVTAIFQDSDGYMWFGTRSGLNRYDGYGFMVYRKDYDNVHSLSGNHIMDVIQDYSRDLWVGTQQGLSRLDYETEEIYRYSLGDNGADNSYVNTLWCTDDNHLLVFTRGDAYIYDREQDTFRLFQLATSERLKNVTSVTGDRLGNIYFGTSSNGIFICDRDFQLKQRLKYSSADPNSLPNGYVSFLAVMSDGVLWIVTEDKVLSYYNSRENRVVRLDDIKNVRQIVEWDDNHLLAGTFHGLILLDKRTLEATPINMNIGEQGGLSHYSVLCLYKDKQQDLWVGTYSGGVNYYNRYNYRFNYVTTQEFSGVIGMATEDEEGCVWFATEGRGLMSYNPKTHEQHNYLVHDPRDKTYNRNIIKSVLRNGRSIFCATHGGEVYEFSLENKSFRLLYDFKYNDIYTLYIDSVGRLWIPTNTASGLVVVRGEERFRGLNAKNKYPSIGSISTIMELKKDCFLLGSVQRGVFIVNLEGENIRDVSEVDFGLNDIYIWVTSMFRDEQGDVWVATNGAGLFRFDRDMKLKKRYYKGNGLLDERVYCIMGKGDELWLMTSRELYLLNVKTDEIHRFYSKNGIIPEEFSLSAGLLARNGKLYLSGTKGFLTFDPTSLTMNTEKPSVLLTTLSLNNEVVKPGEKQSLLSRKLQLEKKLVLKHNQTNLTIGYTALNYIYPEQNQYAYKMSGVDDRWNYVGNRREAFYSNLKPGEYTFQVVASNNDGIWNETGAKLQIVVLSPLWLRWWAWLIYTLLVIFVVYQIVAYRHRKHELERSLRLKQLEQEKLEELGQERTRFFTHVTHEFRTPLTLIINPLDELLQKYVHIAGVKDSLLLIRRNAQRLLSLVNSLMDIEKQQSGKAALVLTNFDFANFIREGAHSFQSVAESRTIHFKVEVGVDFIPVRYDREKLEQVFFNLLSNAFKFTPAQGEVRVRVCLLDEAAAIDEAEGKTLPVNAEKWLYVGVEDNGIGIDPQKADKIFEPFYQSGEDVHGQIMGSGIGLSLSKAIVEQHEGIIFARPLKQGTEMCVLLPYRYAPDLSIEENYVLNEEKETELANRKKCGTTDTLKTAFRSDYKVLLVEDNAEVLEYLQNQLSGEYVILTAKNGKEALELTEQELPDMVISDVMMPEMDGVELCSRIKGDIRLCHIPVILLTAKSMTLHIEEGYSAGADDYIAKPFSISLLKIRIHNLFANREQMKEIFSKKFSLESLGIEVESADQTFMDRYVEIVKKNFTNPRLDVDMICQEMGMSRANFYKKLKTITDLSPAEMVRNIRLESAARLLRETKLTISEIAIQVGFSSNSYFGSCFKALYGISPKEFQNTKE